MVRLDEIATMLPERAWQHDCAGAGSKGQRWYSWA